MMIPGRGAAGGRCDRCKCAGEAAARTAPVALAWIFASTGGEDSRHCASASTNHMHELAKNCGVGCMSTQHALPPTLHLTRFECVVNLSWRGGLFIWPVLSALVRTARLLMHCRLASVRARRRCNSSRRLASEKERKKRGPSIRLMAARPSQLEPRHFGPFLSLLLYPASVRMALGQPPT